MTCDFVFTSDSVTEGHPDKLCDQISDAIIDAYLSRDREAEVIAESAVANGVVFISNRFVSSARVDVAEVARRVIADAGYADRDGFNAEECTILTSSQDLAAARGPRPVAPVPEALERIVAGNQVNSFGFACRQSETLMPLPIHLAHGLCRGMDEARRGGALDYLRSDGQVQVGIEYADGRPRRISGITVLASHAEGRAVGNDRMRDDLFEAVIEPVLADAGIAFDRRSFFHLNPFGPIAGGGPDLHSGLTGRKNGIDNYGEYSRHGGAALSGKDPLRIDRVGSYMARYAAKNVVAAGLAEQCEVHLGYGIGQAGPVSVRVQTFGTGELAEEAIKGRLTEAFDFRLGAIIHDLRLREWPAHQAGRGFRQLATYGHMGREDLRLPWERTDRVDALRG